jgi:hypothetical protein
VRRRHTDRPRADRDEQRLVGEFVELLVGRSVHPLQQRELVELVELDGRRRRNDWLLVELFEHQFVLGIEQQLGIVRIDWLGRRSARPAGLAERR